MIRNTDEESLAIVAIITAVSGLFSVVLSVLVFGAQAWLWVSDWLSNS